MIVGSGAYRYRVNENWANLPDGWSFKEVGGVGVDSRDCPSSEFLRQRAC